LDTWVVDIWIQDVSLSLSLGLVQETSVLEIALRMNLSLSLSLSLKLVQGTCLLEIAVRILSFSLFEPGTRDFRIGDCCKDEPLLCLSLCSWYKRLPFWRWLL
jgi:hypothetical protein